MAVLVIGEVKGQTQQGYEGMLILLSAHLERTPGFILLTAHAVADGWRVIEMWETANDANQFFAKHIAPNLPAGIRPKRSVQELHSVVKAQAS